MSDWSQGYPTGSAYLDAMQPEISPFRWRIPLMTARRLPPGAHPSFRFLELGCGSAQTLVALAACYPDANFAGYDFMPEHVVRARMMIDAVGLENIRVEEASFSDLARQRPDARFDFAALHGVWTWVSDAVRDEITAVLDQWLAPGAVAYLGYNSAAGWAPAEPLRQIFRELPRGHGKEGYATARAAVQDWIDAVDPPGIARVWDKLANLPDEFLAHEIASEHGTGIWHGDLAAALAQAKMGYACPAFLGEQFDALFLPAERTALLRKADAEGWGETARDLVHRRTFRADLFHRGAPALSVAEMVAQLRPIRVAAWDPELELADFLAATGSPQHGVDPQLLARLKAPARDAPATLGDCMDALGSDAVKAVQLVLVALVSGELLELRDPAQTDAARESTARFNGVARKFLEMGTPLQGLASPALGGCVALSPEKQRVAFGLEQGDKALEKALELLGVAA